MNSGIHSRVSPIIIIIHVTFINLVLCSELEIMIACVHGFHVFISKDKQIKMEVTSMTHHRIFHVDSLTFLYQFIFLFLFFHLIMRDIEISITKNRHAQLFSIGSVITRVTAPKEFFFFVFIRGSEDHAKLATVFKSDKRSEMVKEGYRILGNSGDQWSDLLGSFMSNRSFKLPNPMYFIV